MSPALTDPITLAGRTAPARVIFGPHVTNLGEGRAFSDGHVAYYERRARGGAGIVVTETASIHPLDHPYERAPLAACSGAGYTRIVEACRPYGTLVLAGLGHRGLQGTSAWTRSPLWAPSRIPDPVTRELPAEMTRDDIDDIVDGFARGAGIAAAADLDGVELDVGPTSLLRQFLSGLTNHRDDEYGIDRALLLREVVGAVRERLGANRILAVRLTCDENAPWAGLTPDVTGSHARELAPVIDLLTVVRGGLFSPETYRPDAHTPRGFNDDLCRSIRVAVDGAVPVVLQGGVVDAGHARRVLEEGVCDLVEMTRAQIADPDLVASVGRGAQPRPCVRCNQACLVEDFRNPVVGCIGNAEAGRENRNGRNPAGRSREVLVVGGGPAGLEAARVAAERGHRVVLVEREPSTGGAARAAAGRRCVDFGALTRWLEGRCRELGVDIRLGRAATPAEIAAALASGTEVIQASGGVPRPPGFPVTAPSRYATAADVLSGTCPDSPRVVVWDPLGGPVAVAVTDHLASRGAEVHYATGDALAGSRLAPTGDLVPANVRMHRAGVRRHLGVSVAAVDAGAVRLVQRVSGEVVAVVDAALVDCSPRLPGREVPGARTAGDCVAPRSVREAIREGNEVAHAL
ncbi:mycofactocin system FadH/OYE family oxidoreductase 1 [Rhodococcus sp. CH91]|uniref:mycofactocin system FadH/OYE family oxidoreductase 1 n=1 Tax=Rhodococcus sp. CH91 TaxID=2910256 RepID=UPI001F4B9853|nr:mycofactocin system FadH/OYE family oxidoreductase 1 [Rhodococcus sp. CH91]